MRRPARIKIASQTLLLKPTERNLNANTVLAMTAIIILMNQWRAGQPHQ